MIPMATLWRSGPTLENITGVCCSQSFSLLVLEKLEPNSQTVRYYRKAQLFTMIEIEKAEVINNLPKY